MSINTIKKTVKGTRNIILTWLIVFSSMKLYKCLKPTPEIKKLQSIEYNTWEIQWMQLVNNKVAFDSIIQHIDHAKESIEIRMFEWNADSIGDTIARKLIQKANSGLKIVIFKDYWWSSVLWESKPFINANFYDSLKYNKNISLYDWYHITWWGKWMSKSRNEINDHSKYRIFDKWRENEVTIIWWMNIGNVYAKQFHDYMLIIHGKWVLQNESSNIDIKRSSKWNGIKILKNSVDSDWNITELQIKPAFLELIDSTQQELIIEMAYLWDPEITQNIINKVVEWKKVSIVIAQEADVQDATNKKTLNTIMKQTKNPDNLSIYQYNWWLHSKIFISDNKAIIGSANFNIQSTEIMGETSVLLEWGISAQMQTIVNNIKKNLQNDIHDSKKITSVEELNYNSIEVFIEEQYSDFKRTLN